MSVNPFSLIEISAYRKWRDNKLSAYPARVADLITPITDPKNLSSNEIKSLQYSCRIANIAIYQCKKTMNHQDVLILGKQLGLTRLCKNISTQTDGISELKIRADSTSSRYIPFSNQPLNWHTDGYYHVPGTEIQSFILHCADPAARGGENKILDHELAYLLLRDQSPDFIAALSQTDAMTIPENRTEEQNKTRIESKSIRSSVTGPVFSVSQSGHLHMRYTSRSRSIHWKDDPILDVARNTLITILEDNPFILGHTLESGQGLICNNVLHCRSGFEDSANRSRLIFRARYFDRVAN